MDKMMVFSIFSAIEMALQVPVTASHFDVFGRHFHEVVACQAHFDVFGHHSHEVDVFLT